VLEDKAAHRPYHDLIYQLRGLGRAGTFLHIGAHPDDEDVGLMCYVARKLGIRIVYWSATRGEGGQNQMGSDMHEALGVYRSWESLAVRRVDGGESMFGPFYDFGFSKNGEETLRNWGGREAVTREVVRAIRAVQPQIVIGRWTGDPAMDGHGHHQAIGSVIREAYSAAGDEAQYPELGNFGLSPWSPSALYFSTGGDWQPGEEGGQFGCKRPELENANHVRIDSGEFDPLAGLTYQEQAWIAFNNHRTQAMGFLPEKESFFYYYSQAYPDPKATGEPSQGFHEKLDPSLSGLATIAGNDDELFFQELSSIEKIAEQCLRQYQSHQAQSAGRDLLGAAARLGQLAGRSSPGLQAILLRKQRDFETAGARCLGLQLECLSDDSHITPGQQFTATARLWHHGQLSVDALQFELSAPDHWDIQACNDPEPHNDGKSVSREFSITVAKTSALTCPYWLQKDRNAYFYHWPESPHAGQAFDPSLVELKCQIDLGDQSFTLRVPALHREAFPGGYRELPLAVVPPISLQPKKSREFLPEGSDSQLIKLQVSAYNNMEHSGVEGSVKLDIPAGWQITPEQQAIKIDEVGGSESYEFLVTIPSQTPAGVYPIKYVVSSGGRDYDVVVNPVRMGPPGLPRPADESNCIREQIITTPAVNNIHLIDAEFVAGQRYAYIQGAAEDLVASLAHFGLDFHVITDEEMGYIDLSVFDAIVVGPNAYLIRDALRKNAARLPRYVADGGTVIVQHQGYGFQRDEFVPYPFKFSQPHDRVTTESAPVSILAPDLFLFNQPNSIDERDFEGWVHDRGMYFFGEFDHRYTPLLACNDSGESAKTGGLLLSSFGRGNYVYCAYSLWRQIPAGVPGAFRLFANLLAVPASRILERVRFLAKIPLFAFMTEAQLMQVAGIITERWAKQGEYLCREGDQGDEMYIIYRGAVQILKEGNGSREKLIYVAELGEAVGELQVLSQRKRSASMRAQDDLHLLVMQGEDFRALMQKHPSMSERVIHTLVEKLEAAGQ
jgi:LmbE family N-acetylglucosaminyl deacetylase